MNPGEYYIGDLCYVMKNNWYEFCETTIKNEKCLEGEFVFENGTRFAAFSTKWGDGTYTDQENRDYNVDAGLIGCILVSDINEEERKHIVDGGHTITFDYPFSPYKTDSGIIMFGDIAIDTNPSDNDYEYDDE